MVYRFDHFLQSNRYETTIAQGKDFYLTTETQSKKVDLFSYDKGRKAITDEEEIKLCSGRQVLFVSATQIH